MPPPATGAAKLRGGIWYFTYRTMSKSDVITLGMSGVKLIMMGLNLAGFGVDSKTPRALLCQYRVAGPSVWLSLVGLLRLSSENMVMK